MRRQKAKPKPKPKPKAKPKPLFVDKKALSIASIAGDNGRFCLDRVHVEPDGTTVVADGRRIIYVDPVQYDADDWPGGIAGKPVKATGAVDIPKKVANDVAKSIPKGNLQRIQVAALTRSDEEVVEFSATDLRQVKRTGYVLSEDVLSFPTWREMVEPPGEPCFTIHMNARLLSETLAALARLSGQEDARVKLTFFGLERPVHMEVTVECDRKARAVQAPIHGR